MSVPIIQPAATNDKIVFIGPNHLSRFLGKKLKATTLMILQATNKLGINVFVSPHTHSETVCDTKALTGWQLVGENVIRNSRIPH